MRKPTRSVSVRKAARISVVTNSLQVLLMLGIIAALFVLDDSLLDLSALRVIVIIVASILAFVSMMDIRDALGTQRMIEQLDAVTDMARDMESLNTTLRAQRHDFLNHLQVVYSLMEMGETEEANRYIEKVYGRITRVSRVMKTACAPVNALLQVKAAACEKAGIDMKLNITTTLHELPMADWALCKVLGNLIDNAMEAMPVIGEKRLTVTLTEDIHSYRFAVENTGATIPEKTLRAIFQPGVTTKGEGHGMGLHIVRRTLEDNGGSIEVTSADGLTVFSGIIPKRPVAPEQAMEDAQADD